MTQYPEHVLKEAEKYALEKGMGSGSSEPRSISILCAEEAAFLAGYELGRREALEEAASTCESLILSSLVNTFTVDRCADAIRTLLPSGEKESQDENR